MMQLRALVKETTGNTQHSHGEFNRGVPVAVGVLPVPTWVEIHQDGGAFLLLHFDAHGNCFADTWHQTLAEAKRQAQHEFRISESDWVQLNPAQRAAQSDISSLKADD